MAITNNFIDATFTTIFTSSGTNAITSMIFCNYQDTDNISGTPGNVLTDADTFLDLHVVPNGGSASDENKILHQLKIPGGETFIMDTERLVLDNNDTIQATADVDSVVYSTMSYVGV